VSRMFVGIDPGVRACGVAVIQHDGVVRDARFIRDDADAVADWVRDYFDGHYGEVVVGIEFPRTYRGRASRGDANDLLELAFAVGRMCGRFAGMLGSADIHPVRVTVDSWKNNTPTDVIEARLRRELLPGELRNVTLPAPSYRHNVWDALALAKWLAAWPRKNPSKDICAMSLL
jgi:RNase H-fold protein (predicted Holliday junction resolvase)